MSTFSFITENSPNAGKSVDYQMVSSIRDVFAQRTSLALQEEAQRAAAKKKAEVTSIHSANAQDDEIRSTPSTTHSQKQPSNQNDIHQPNRFSHLLSVMPAGVVVIDHRGIVTLANQQASALLEEPLEGELWRDVIERAFRPQADDGHEVSMRNGKRVKIDISPLTEEKGQLIVITDLTETRQLQHRLSHMQRLSSLGKMVASLAHQVRTPLSSALLYAENIKSVQPSQSTTARFSEKLIMRLKDLESQVNDMLLFAKSGDNQIVKAMSAQDITNISTQNIEAQFAQADVSLKVENNASDIPLMCNLTALSGAIGNLLGNALQAVSNNDAIEGKPQVELIVQKTTVSNIDYVQFCVLDNGSGLNEKEIRQMFEPFYTTKSQGTGLGLAVVNTVAKSHKGFVSCSNRQDSTGAQFSISIPVTPNLQAARSAQATDSDKTTNVSSIHQPSQSSATEQSAALSKGASA